MDPSSAEAVRETLASLDTRGQKIVAGLFGVMIQNAPQVRDREWMSQQLTEMSLLAGDFDGNSTDEVVAAVQAFVQANAETLLTSSLLLFQRVALDLQPRAAEGFTFDEAMRIAIEYLPDVDEAPSAEA